MSTREITIKIQKTPSIKDSRVFNSSNKEFSAIEEFVAKFPDCEPLIIKQLERGIFNLINLSTINSSTDELIFGKEKSIPEMIKKDISSLARYSNSSSFLKDTKHKEKEFLKLGLEMLKFMWIKIKNQFKKLLGIDKKSLDRQSINLVDNLIQNNKNEIIQDIVKIYKIDTKILYNMSVSGATEIKLNRDKSSETLAWKSSDSSIKFALNESADPKPINKIIFDSNENESFDNPIKSKNINKATRSKTTLNFKKVSIN